ncbi:MFS general substrate transporter-48 [Coleophoma cylindrospora]|uniref:MFS general substrate transporter-48 n=1 Tax=Coleophoma cylindrospora TaxID=1849047 RepID=A0A3D8RSE3_9HELO|nr:MFS general substrate transporter-48 [Coleophoma cylindrospora]
MATDLPNVERRNQSPTRHFDRNEESADDKGKPTKWSMGVLNDSITHEVPGSVLLLTGARNAPLGLRNAPARTSHSSLPTSQNPSRSNSVAPEGRRHSRQSKPSESKKKTPDGAIILEPQPDDSHNDPLNWPSWRRDSALLSLGLYCMVGGGMTPILAAGFSNVASTYNVAVSKVSLTTGLYMMGLGVGSVLASPTAILYGKRPVYLFGAIMFIATSCWCAASPSYNSLLIARIFQGMSVSPVECLPSATIAEIFFLHERAYRIGIYTLLLLGGKNLVPLVSAAIIQSMEWRWVFWIVAMVVGFCWILLFLFVPETFWDRTPRPKDRTHAGSRRASVFSFLHPKKSNPTLGVQTDGAIEDPGQTQVASRPHRSLHVGFAPGELDSEESTIGGNDANVDEITPESVPKSEKRATLSIPMPARHTFESQVEPQGGAPQTPALHNFNSPAYVGIERSDSDYLERGQRPVPDKEQEPISEYEKGSDALNDNQQSLARPGPPPRYTTILKEAPKLTFAQQLRPWNGRLHQDNWFRVAFRPFVLFAYPAVLWSAVVYSCSVGWLIVLSESVSVIYRSKSTYNFSALSAGLIYLSPFIGGVLGTAVAGKVSDMIVRAMSKRNGGLYEPEFRLVMAIPITISTVIGLMGFGWSAQIHDQWIVPTIFFGIISFGCSLGSTTSITFCVDSYRQYAGEALVTLNFSKNILHGLIFSLFFTSWLETDGSKKVFIYVGIIQLICMAFSIPMYIFGKRARMWTVRKNFMEKF